MRVGKTNYRKLEAGEILMDGDLMEDPYGSDLWSAFKLLGKRVGEGAIPDTTFFRPITKKEAE